MTVDIARFIVDAKLGATRKYAQDDMCPVFARALYEVLTAASIPSQVYTVSLHLMGERSAPQWYHAVVKVGDQYFDSMGVFDESIVRSRMKVHPKVTISLVFKRDRPEMDDEFSELHKFYVKQLNKSLKVLMPQMAVPKNLKMILTHSP